MTFDELLTAALELGQKLEKDYPQPGDLGVSKWLEDQGVEDVADYLPTMPGAVPFVGGLLAGFVLANAEHPSDE